MVEGGRRLTKILAVTKRFSKGWSCFLIYVALSLVYIIIQQLSLNTHSHEYFYFILKVLRRSSNFHISLLDVKNKAMPLELTSNKY